MLSPLNGGTLMAKQNSQFESKPGGVNFLITIHHQENHSWQGTIQWIDTNRKQHFRSELELMNLINEAVNKSQKEQQNFRTWEGVGMKKSIEAV